MHIYKASEWQSATGKWHVNDTSDLTGQSALWWMPARVLDLTPAAYIEWLIKNYAPDDITWNGKILLFSWNKGNYGKAHSYLLYINRIARNKKFMC